MAPSDPDASKRRSSPAPLPESRASRKTPDEKRRADVAASDKGDGWETYEEEDPWVTAPELKQAPPLEPHLKDPSKPASNVHNPHQFDVSGISHRDDAAQGTFRLQATIGGALQPEERFTGNLGQMSVRIGRAEGNQMVVIDPSVSREHAELRVANGLIILRDLGSGNGTFVNDARIEEMQLESEASFLVGQVKIRSVFLREAKSIAAAPPNDASSGVASALLVPLGDEAHNALPNALGSGQPPPAPSRLSTIAKLLTITALVGASLMAGLYVTGRIGPRAEARRLSSEGTQALAANDLEKAKACSETGLALAPKEKEVLKLKRLVARASTRQTLLKRSQDALEAGQYGEAEKLAGQIEPGYAHELAQEVLRRSTEAQHRMLIAIHSDLEAGRTAEGLATAVRLAAQAPNNQAAQALVIEAQQKQAQADAVVVRPPRRRFEVPRPMRPQPVFSPDVARALSLAKAGNFAGAQALLRGQSAPEARETTRALAALAETYEGGLLEHRGKRAFAAIKTLGRARAEAARLLGPSWLTTDIDQKMADMYYVLGVQAFGGRNFAEARASFLQAVELCRGHALSLQKLREFEVRAATLLGEAESLGRQDTGRVRSLLEEVMALTGGQGATAERARALLKMLP